MNNNNQPKNLSEEALADRRIQEYLHDKKGHNMPISQEDKAAYKFNSDVVHAGTSDFANRYGINPNTAPPEKGEFKYTPKNKP